MLKLSESRYYFNVYEKAKKEYLASGCPIDVAEHMAMFRTEHAFGKHCDFKDKLDILWNQRYGKEIFEKGVFFLTIRPVDNTKFEPFYNLIHKIFSRKFWTSYYLVFEQKGETKVNLGSGFHIHCICKVHSASKGKSYYINEIYREVSKEKLDCNIAMNCIDLKKIDSQDDYIRRMNYINTDEFLKKDEYKRTCWNLDAEWRLSLRLSPFYDSTSTPLPSKDVWGVSPLIKSICRGENYNTN